MAAGSYDLPPHPKVVSIKQIKKIRDRLVRKKSLVMILPILKKQRSHGQREGLDRVSCGYPLVKTEAPRCLLGSDNRVGLIASVNQM